MLVRFLMAVLVGSVCMTSTAQMIKAPTKPAEPVKKKQVSKPKVIFKEEDEVAVDTLSAAKIADTKFAYLIIKANKGSGISVNINNEESGRIKANMSKKIPLDNADEMRISLADTEGNQYDTTFVVEEKDAGKTIQVTFPEVDYAAIRNERIRLKKEQELKEQLEAQEALRIKNAAEAALREYRKDLLTEKENQIKAVIQQHLTEKAGLQELISRIKKGEIPLDESITKIQEQLVSNKTDILQSIKLYTDSSVVYNLKEQREGFLKDIKTDYDRIFKDKFYESVTAYVTGVRSGKQPMSENVEVAFKASRSFDIPFFISKDSLEEAAVSGKYPLLYALEVKSNVSVFKYLFENGVTPNNYGSRFTENKEVYATPFAYACINGDLEVIKAFIANQAQFFPAAMSKTDKKKQVKFLLSKFGNKKEVVSLLKESNYSLDDGSAAIQAALNHIDSSMVLVEEGSFMMGCTNSTSSCSADEKPAIKVTLDAYYISKFEITQKEWAAIMDDDAPSFFTDCGDCPVEMVNWKTANSFIVKLNTLTGKNYRLPTEAEWEYAARGGKSENAEFIYSGGIDINEVGWHKDNSSKTSGIGLKKANPLGLYDMSGNVAEWCSDFYAADYFSRSSQVNPKGPEVSAERVTRGGSFMQSSWSSRISNREGHEEEFVNNSVGFRLAMTK